MKDFFLSMTPSIGGEFKILDNKQDTSLPITLEEKSHRFLIGIELESILETILHWYNLCKKVRKKYLTNVSFNYSIKKKVKGGTGGGAQTNNCKTLPNSSNSPGMGGLTHHMQAGNNAGNAMQGPKHPGARNSGTMGDATTAGEAISSAIVKYNYQAQQVKTIELYISS